MDFLVQFWLPILLAGVLVFLVSSVVHMVLPIHKSDYRRLPNEDGALQALREASVEPGEYCFPFLTSMKDMTSEEMTRKYEQGPVGFMTVLPRGVPNMGKSLLHWFLYTLVVGVFCAYVGSFALAGQVTYMEGFRLTGTVAFIGYGMCNVTNSIWKGAAWSTTFKFAFDGLLYALATAGTFAWLWPSA